MKVYHFTKDGYDKLTNERETLLAERPRVVSDLKRARELGDLSENGFYKSTKMRLNQIDGRLFRIGIMLKYGKIIQSSGAGVVELGSTVELSDGNQTITYMIVGSEEANPREGKISNISPLGKLLLGNKKGAEIRLGNSVYTLLSVK